MGRIWVDIDFDSVDTDDLISELEGRWLDDREEKRLLQIIKSGDTEFYDLMAKLRERFTLAEIRDMMQEDLTVKTIPKEQIAIPFSEVI